MKGDPVQFDVQRVAASRDGAEIAVEIHAMAGIRMVFRFAAREALELAHDLERAYHQLRDENLVPTPPKSPTR